MARPSDYTEVVADEICRRLIEGESLVEICEGSDMPSRASVYRWMEAHPDFDTRCARAREGQADYMDSLILRTANTCTNETAQADRVKIAAYQWRAAKLSPRKYGDKVAHVGGSPEDAPVRFENVTNKDRAKAMAALIARSKADG